MLICHSILSIRISTVLCYPQSVLVWSLVNSVETAAYKLIVNFPVLLTVALCCFSLIEFFKKMKKWADMASLPQEFRDKIERLERNFAVSMVTFKKFEPIFLDIFENPAKDPPRPPKSRKQKYVVFTSR